jgi:formamidopyrimidine-DNA glycosylase
VPELPEVETIKEDLRALVVGSRIERAEIRDEKLVEEALAEGFSASLSGNTILDVSRRGKHLILELEDDKRAAFQLKIGGQLLLVPPVEEPANCVMLVLHLENLEGGGRLFLRDETGYTRAQLLTAQALRERLERLGPEPLEPGFSVEYLRRVAGNRRSQIKPLILDQSIASGVGNIYADEALYDARIHPRRKASSLSEAEWDALHRAVRENLAAGVEHRGTTFSLYRDVLGREGGHQHHLKVFLREGEPCPACDSDIIREQVGGRATFLCPACQEERVAGEPSGGGDLQLELGL